MRNLTTIHGGKRILVAVDGSVHAKAAFEHAINYVDPKKDELFIMTIPPVVFSNDEFMGTQLNVMIQEKIEEKVQKTREHYEALARDVPVSNFFPPLFPCPFFLVMEFSVFFFEGQIHVYCWRSD